VYQRVQQYRAYQIITTVNDDGVYEQVRKWADGVITSHYKSNIFKMGWKSVKEFLKEKRGFVKV